jgi:PAS domain S-box-containing protein
VRRIVAALKKTGSSWKIPLFLLLVVPFVIQIALISILTTSISFLSTGRAMEYQALRARMNIARGTGEYINALLEKPQLINRLNAEALRLGNPSSTDQQGLIDLFKSQIKIIEGVSSIYFGTPRGGIVNAGREIDDGSYYTITTENLEAGTFLKHRLEGDGNPGPLVSSVPDFDARTRPWYTRALEEDGPAWSDIYILFTGQDMAFSASQPVRDARGALLGVVSFDLFLGNISRYLKATMEEMSFSGESQSFIVEESGLLVATSTLERPFQEEGQGFKRIPAAESASPLTREAVRTIKARGDSFFDLGEEALHLDFSLNNQPYYLDVTPVVDDEGLNWYVCTVIPQAVFLSSLDRVRDLNVLLALLATFLALGIGFFTARIVTLPIRRLSASTKRIADGEWPDSFRSEWIQELDSLSSCSQIMLTRLKKSMTDLSDKVEQLEKVEGALRESERELNGFFKAVPIGIGVNLDGFFLKINDRFCEMTGYSREELTGAKVDLLYFDMEECKRVSEEIVKNRDLGLGAQTETLWRCKDGSAMNILLTAALLWPDQGRREIAFSALNITERKKAEQARLAMEEEHYQNQKVESIGRLAGGVAHDLNNLLSPILGYGEILVRDFDREGKEREYTEQILKAGYRARDLVQQLLAFSRKQALEYREINFNDVLRDFEKLLRRTIKEDIELEIITSPDLPLISADKGQIEQVIMNLVVNAQDAMPDGGLLQISTSSMVIGDEYFRNQMKIEPGRYVVISFKDTGHGIDSATMKQIFEPFFSTKNEKGVGFGLATVYGIVKQHGGWIFVDSSPGNGTLFDIYLPASEEHPPLAPKKAKASHRESRKGDATILVAEDNQLVRDLARTILEDSGFRVITAEDGEKALQILSRGDEKVDLLLTDVIMPRMNGKELYLLARVVNPELKVIFMSGYTDNAISRHGVIEEGINFIQKPFSLETLMSKVWEVLLD